MKIFNKQLLFNRFRLRLACLFMFCCLGLGLSSQGASIQGLGDYFKALTIANGDIIGVSATDAIVRSVNGGVDFSELREGDGVLQSIGSDGNITIAGGEFGRLLRVDLIVDATTWVEVASSDTFGSVTGIAGDDDNTWLATTDSSGDLLRSTDNGFTWSLGSSAPSAELSAVVYDAISGNWIAVGGDFFNSQAFYSSDSINWQVATGLSGGPLYSVAVDSVGTIIAVGEGGILRSTDGGESFVAVANAPSEALYSVVAIAEGVFAAVGFEGVVVEIIDTTVSIVQSSVPGAQATNAVIAFAGVPLIPGLEAVTAPSIDPNGGNSADPFTVTLTIPANTLVYYTTDGALPSEESTLYTGPFVLAETTTLRAVAVKDGISSASVTADFIITVVLDQLPALEISVVDPNTFQIALNESAVDRNYQLQTSSNLTSWDPILPVQAGTGSALTWSVSRDGDSRFYRVIIQLNVD